METFVFHVLIMFNFYIYLKENNSNNKLGRYKIITEFNMFFSVWQHHWPKSDKK